MHECSICLDSIYPAKYQLPCKHLFHITCIKTWLKNRPSCPICREVIINNHLCYRKIPFRYPTAFFIRLSDNYMVLKEFGGHPKIIDYTKIKHISYKKKNKKNILNIGFNDKTNLNNYTLLIESINSAKGLYNNINSRIHNSDYNNILIMQMHTQQSLNR